QRGFEMQVGLDPDGKIGQMFNVSSIPQSVVIDPDGNVARLHVGASPRLGDELFKAIESILNEEL
ncbi:MAG: hypothetical protein AAF456_19065, partial [Planctomycetota bacterium]